jgi:tetratricopeptide (TPR) repeat protein
MSEKEKELVHRAEQQLLDDLSRHNRDSDYAAAERALDQLIAMFPNGVGAPAATDAAGGGDTAASTVLSISYRRSADLYYWWRAEARAKLGKAEAAILDWRAAFRVCDDLYREIQILTEKTRLLERLGTAQHLLEAVDDLESLIRIAPSHAPAYTSLSLVASKLGRIDLELIARNELLLVKPNDWKGYSHRLVTARSPLAHRSLLTLTVHML